MCCVYLQPDCKYLIQLRAEGNDHIERALPQHRAIEVGQNPTTQRCCWLFQKGKKKKNGCDTQVLACHENIIDCIKKDEHDDVSH